MKAELFPMQLCNDSDPIEIFGHVKAAEKIDALYQPEEGQTVYVKCKHTDVWDYKALGHEVWLKQLTLPKMPTKEPKMKLIKDRPIEDPDNPQWDTDW